MCMQLKPFLSPLPLTCDLKAVKNMVAMVSVPSPTWAASHSTLFHYAPLSLLLNVLKHHLIL